MISFSCPGFRRRLWWPLNSCRGREPSPEPSWRTSQTCQWRQKQRGNRFRGQGVLTLMDASPIAADSSSGAAPSGHQRTVWTPPDGPCASLSVTADPWGCRTSHTHTRRSCPPLHITRPMYCRKRRVRMTWLQIEVVPCENIPAAPLPRRALNHCRVQLVVRSLQYEPIAALREAAADYACILARSDDLAAVGADVHAVDASAVQLVVAADERRYLLLIALAATGIT